MIPDPNNRVMDLVRHHMWHESDAPVLGQEHERTAPLDLHEPRGPRHADFRALAEGHGGPLLLAERYQVLARIGRGGMSTVFRGRTINTGRMVAIKVLDEERSSDVLERFVAEASITGRVWGPHVVEVVDFGSTAEGVVYLVMELLEGEELRDILRREGPLPWPRVRELMLEICAGLSAIHAGGVTHRDLKPANCFCVPSDRGIRVKLLDFGIATCASLRAIGQQRMTEDGRVVGTPEYMSPEHARGERTDERADVYAAGIILGELLTGQIPFEGKSSTSVLAQHIYEPAPRLSELAGPNVVIDPALDDLYAKALAKHPVARFQSAAELAEAIASVRVAEQGRWTLGAMAKRIARAIA
jgi:serine/threonine-protein kinase